MVLDYSVVRHLTVERLLESGYQDQEPHSISESKPGSNRASNPYGEPEAGRGSMPWWEQEPNKKFRASGSAEARS